MPRVEATLMEVNSTVDGNSSKLVLCAFPAEKGGEFWYLRKMLNYPPDDDVNFTYLSKVAPNIDMSALKSLNLAARYSGTGDFHRVRVLGEGREGRLHVEFVDYGSEREDIRLDKLRTIRDDFGELPPPFLVKYNCDGINLTAPLEDVRAAIRPYLKNVHFDFTAPNKASDVQIELEKDSGDFADLKGHLIERNMAQ